MRRLFILIFVIPLFAQAQEIPVLLFLSTNDQDDSIGFNLVKSLPEFAYEQIMAGKAVLWDSPKKEERIEPKTLLQIEKYAQSSFKVTNQLFIYENWIRTKKNLTVKPVGFYFSSKKANGEETAYGFIDYASLDSLFRFTLVPANADGNCGMTYDDALKQKLYYFNIVQYGEERISSLERSLKIKNEIKSLLPPKKWSEQDDCKIVRYAIEDSAGSANESVIRSRKFLALVEKYLSESPEFFMNFGGDRLTNDPTGYKIKVNRVEVDEYWIRTGDKIDYSIFRMTVVVNDSILDPISSDDLQKMDLLIGFKPVNDALKEKEFYFRILKINSQAIPPEKSAAYLNGLYELRWSHLIEWARYQ